MEYLGNVLINLFIPPNLALVGVDGHEVVSSHLLSLAAREEEDTGDSGGDVAGERQQGEVRYSVRASLGGGLVP